MCRASQGCLRGRARPTHVYTQSSLFYKVRMHEASDCIPVDEMRTNLRNRRSFLHHLKHNCKSPVSKGPFRGVPLCSHTSTLRTKRVLPRGVCTSIVVSSFGRMLLRPVFALVLSWRMVRRELMVQYEQIVHSSTLLASTAVKNMHPSFRLRCWSFFFT